MKTKLLVLFLGSFLTGCVHYMPAAVSSTSIGSKFEAPVMTVTGISSAYYIFGIGPTGDDSLNAAIEDAKSNAPSDSIANVFVDRRLICFPICGFSIFTRIDTMIYGTLVKYTKEDGKALEKTTAHSAEPTYASLPELPEKRSENKGAEKVCYTYDCLSGLKEGDLKSAIDKLSQKEKDFVASTANKKVRACYAEKTTNNIVIPPEFTVWEGERRLLEYLCQAGLLQK